MLSEIVGLCKDGQEAVNDKTFKVLDVKSTSEFVIDCDASGLSDYERNGLVKGIKPKVEVEFQDLKTVLGDLSGQMIDMNFMDFEKLENFKHTQYCYKLYGEEFKYDVLSKKEVEFLKDMSNEEK